MARRLVPYLLTALTLAALPAPAGPPPAETIEYRWSLGGFLGTLARVLLPGEGAGQLTSTPLDAGVLELELLITSEKSEQGEFWLYRSRIDPENGRTLYAESEYEYRDKQKHRQSDLEEENVIDIASGIHLIRTRRPADPLDLKIWSDGKIYPVTVEPRGWTERQVLGEPLRVEHFAIRPRKVPGEREWKGDMDLYLADDEASTPVEITVDRSLARVRLRLVDGSE